MVTYRISEQDIWLEEFHYKCGKALEIRDIDRDYDYNMPAMLDSPDVVRNGKKWSLPEKDKYPCSYIISCENEHYLIVSSYVIVPGDFRHYDTSMYKAWVLDKNTMTCISTLNHGSYFHVDRDYAYKFCRGLLIREPLT